MVGTPMGHSPPKGRRTVVFNDVVSASVLSVPHLSGFVDLTFVRFVFRETSLVKEATRWKWYGNQGDVAP